MLGQTHFDVSVSTGCYFVHVSQILLGLLKWRIIIKIVERKCSCRLGQLQKTGEHAVLEDHVKHQI